MSFDRTKSPGYMTNWVARLFAREMDRELAPLGISSGHLPVFFALADGRALTQKALTEIAAIEQPTMAATLARMDRDGLVRREPDPDDRRAVRVSLSAAALERVPAVLAAIDKVNGIALADFTAAERTGLELALGRIVLALGGR